MRIIDTHCHSGASMLSEINIHASDLLETMDAHGIDLSLVMPHAVTANPIAAHDQIAELCRQYPQRFRGIANLSPVQAEESYRREITRCIRDLGFIAIKLNPMQHLTSPVMANADKVFDMADELGVPVIVHTGIGAPWSLPSLCIPPAMRHPNLPIILAHAGFAIYAAEAYVAASVCPNIYIEPSWCTIHDMQMFVKKIGVGRMMFGSDVPENVPIELAKYRALNLSDKQLADCLSRTAARVFRLSDSK